jgi:hypothetical protein
MIMYVDVCVCAYMYVYLYIYIYMVGGVLVERVTLHNENEFQIYGYVCTYSFMYIYTCTYKYLPIMNLRFKRIQN